MAVAWQLAIDTVDPACLIPFWCAALGYVPEPPPPGFASWRDKWLADGHDPADLGEDPEGGSDAIVDPAGTGPRIFFQRVPEPKAGKNRLHLDLRVSDRVAALPVRRAAVDAAAGRLRAIAGADVRTLAPAGADHYAVVLHDPEGNELCLV